MSSKGDGRGGKIIRAYFFHTILDIMQVDSPSSIMH
jgi:hypothetical protein